MNDMSFCGNWKLYASAFNCTVYLHEVISKSDNFYKYVGFTTKIPYDLRWEKGLEDGYRSNQKFLRILKDNKGVNTIPLFTGLEFKEGLLTEINMIKLFKTFAPDYKDGLNLTLGGEGIRGFKHSEETKNKYSECRKGVNHPRAKFTQNQIYVVRLRLAMGDSQPEIAKYFNTSTSTISHINNGIAWHNDDINYPINLNYVSEASKLKSKGENNSNAKLIQNQVDEIVDRLLFNKETQKSISNDYSISPTRICDINKGKNWYNPYIAKTVGYPLR